MNKSLAVIMIMGLCITVGCHRKTQTAELDVVPPPIEPVQIQPMAPVQFVDPVAPAPQAAMSSSYTIQKGDTLWKIAEAQYGNGQRWQDIAAANPGINPKKLAVGQTLTLP